MTDRNLHDFYILLAFMLAYVTTWSLNVSDPIVAVLVLWLLFGIPVGIVYAIHAGRRSVRDMKQD
jgi:hypothetical protein